MENFHLWQDEDEDIQSGGGELVKTKSYDDLLAGTSPPSHQPLRRSSDPNIRERWGEAAHLRKYFPLKPVVDSVVIE